MDEDKLNNLDAKEIATKIISGEFHLMEMNGKYKLWKVYYKITNQHGFEISDYVCCKNCKKVLKYHKMSRSNLVKHKCYSHRSSFYNENSKVEVDNPIAETEVDEERDDSFKNLLTKWIIKDCRPYNLVQNEDLLAIFQEIARLGSELGEDLDIKKLLPTEPVIGQNVSTIYEQCFVKVKSEMDSIKDNGFGLTSDIWSDNLSKQSYIALTIHYLKNGQLKYRLLGLQSIEGVKSSSQNVVEKINQIVKDFDCELSTKSIIVTDKEIFKTIPHVNRLPCISQLLDCALLKSVGEIDDAAQVISFSLELVKYLKKMGLDGLLGGSLKNCYPTRWILIHKLLYSIESNWNEIVKTLQSANEIVSKINIHHLRAMIKTLQPFEEAIETLEDDSCPTLHLVLMYFHELKKSCYTSDHEFKEFDFIKNLKENLRWKLEKIVTENVTIIHKLALFLFPPTNKLLQFSDEEKKIVDEECIRLMKSFKMESKPIIKQTHEESFASVSKRSKLYSDFVEIDASHDLNELIINEIQYYKNTRVVNSGNFDMFGWWEVQKDNFPLLYKLSCCILATPATSSASKRIFLTARKLLCEPSYQASQEAEVEKIMFINSNSGHDELESYLPVRDMS